ncbi:MAG: hypothetical protein PHI47_04105 [Sulfuricurvum sp.]|uniref:alginate O-acetyltransferase AlgX-related protein n=1 Tax=Sulfuricurvum sp. TaxID=2025608 RepID=UPI002637C6ED|nr:hypothetical protein [Sulfuricurvum sp.]MDD5159209.1 hypothetical protein [Sulfuricurvum sp.]
MSYQIHSLVPRIEQHTLPRKHFDKNNWKNEPIDLITIGDSFSNGGGGGKNPYYQDFIATSQQINVLNIQNINNFSYIDTIRYLHQKQWFNKIKPKAILIESVAREAINHLPSHHHTISTNDDLLFSQIFKKNNCTYFPKPLIINTANYKAPYYYIKYHFSPRANKEVYKFDLSKNLFTATDPNHLLVYNDDLKNINIMNNKTITQLNQELNTLANELKKDGIVLIFMPVVDKYDLYYDWIEEKNIYPKNPFFLLLRQQKQNYIVVDTKAILHPLIEKNIQDIYYADDSHWTYKASEYIANSKLWNVCKHSNDI